MQNRFSFDQLAGSPLRIPLEQLVSEHAPRRWTVNNVRDLADAASHPAALLSDGSYTVFAKFNDASNGFEQFEIELAGLRLLSERSGVLVPNPIGIVPVAGGCILLLEAVQPVERGPRQWCEIGHALATIHQSKWDWFGRETHNYFGSLYQDNSPMKDWPTFYAERRLLPVLKLATDSGNLPWGLGRQLEQLIARLPGLCGPAVIPTLLHGDAQQNNFISTASGAVVIDPAVYFGHPEMDLAVIDFFQPVPQAVFDGYQEKLPIDPGFWEMRDLWCLWGYLACVAVDGPGYLGKLTEAVQKYM